MKIKLKEVSQRLKGWTLYRLAKESNISLARIYKIQKGRSSLTNDDLDKICTLLGCDVCDILEVETAII